jgi:hypothetical protein
VIAVAVVRMGVTPFPVTMFGVTVPLYQSTPAPVCAEPTPKYVTVPEPPVPAGKEISAAGLTLFAVTVHPPEVRATATRVYEV